MPRRIRARASTVGRNNRVNVARSSDPFDPSSSLLGRRKFAHRTGSSMPRATICSHLCFGVIYRSRFLSKGLYFTWRQSCGVAYITKVREIPKVKHYGPYFQQPERVPHTSPMGRESPLSCTLPRKGFVYCIHPPPTKSNGNMGSVPWAYNYPVRTGYAWCRWAGTGTCGCYLHCVHFTQYIFPLPGFI
jgi:hypothetical protein